MQAVHPGRSLVVSFKSSLVRDTELRLGCTVRQDSRFVLELDAAVVVPQTRGDNI